MNIDELTIGEAKQLASMFPTTQSQTTQICPFEIGKSYFIRTVTYHLTGRIRLIIGSFLVLDEAAWIADSGRYATALKTSTLNEVEPLPDGTIVNLASITDSSPWNHKLPKEQK